MGVFHVFLNCTNGTKLRESSQIIVRPHFILRAFYLREQTKLLIYIASARQNNMRHWKHLFKDKLYHDLKLQTFSFWF